MARTHHQDVTGRRRRIRGKAKQVYNTARWARIRAIKLRRDPFCDWCLGLAEAVDHIIDIESGGDPYDYANLRSMCNSCHSKKTAGAKRENQK